jgi:hypothetical protein
VAKPSCRRTPPPYGPTFHPAKGSRLTLADALHDDPARVLARSLAEYPELIDVRAYLTRHVSRYVLALEDVADEAGRKGDLSLRARCLLALVRVAEVYQGKPPDGTPTPDYDEDLSGVPTEELERLLGRR